MPPYTLTGLARRRDGVRFDDEADAPVAERDQMLDQAPSPTGAVAQDDVALHAGDGSVDQDERHAELRQAAQVTSRAVADRRDRNSFDSVGDHLLNDVSFDRQVRPRVAEDHAVVGAASDILGPAHDQGEERIRHVGDDQGECSRLLPDQPAGEAARDVAELGDGLLDPPPRLGADPFAPVDHARDGHRRDAGEPCHVLDRHVAVLRRHCASMGSVTR
jgi:hypothetical protein